MFSILMISHRYQMNFRVIVGRSALVIYRVMKQSFTRLHLSRCHWFAPPSARKIRHAMYFNKLHEVSTIR